MTQRPGRAIFPRRRFLMLRALVAIGSVLLVVTPPLAGAEPPPERSAVTKALFKNVGEGFTPPAKNEALQALLAQKPRLTFYEACGVGDATQVARQLKEDPKLATSWNDFGWTPAHLA